LGEITSRPARGGGGSLDIAPAAVNSNLYRGFRGWGNYKVMTIIVIILGLLAIGYLVGRYLNKLGDG
jgi:hypothetical protein